MYNKTIIRFGFCDILNNQGLGKGYYLDLDYSGYHKNLIQYLFIIIIVCGSFLKNNADANFFLKCTGKGMLP